MSRGTRRRFVKAAVGLSGSLRLGAAEAKKNVLLIAVDDLRPALGCYGARHIRSPKIDRLAAGGTLFERAYCQQAVCGPSRASLLSGARPQTTGVHSNATPLTQSLPGVLTLPAHFRRNGYETVSLSKIYHHPSEDPDGWSLQPWRPSGDWAGRGYLADSSRAAVRAHRGSLQNELGVTDPNHPRKGTIGPAFERADMPDSAYPDGVTLDKAIGELQRLRNKRFFLAVGFLRPHLPFSAPARYWDQYAPGDLPMPSRNTWPEHAPELAMTNWPELRKYGGMPREGPVEEQMLRRLIQGYSACVSYVDALVGRLMHELDRLHLREKTTVVLWGDHGWKLGDYGAWGKATAFEIDARAPMIVNDPDLGHGGQTSRALVELVDIYPTLSELCGLSVPARCEGSSMVPLLEKPDRGWKQAAFSQRPTRGGIMGHSIRTARWRYTEWIKPDTEEILASELYDHSNGPIAADNLAERSDHAKTVRQLSAVLDKGRGWQRVRANL